MSAEADNAQPPFRAAPPCGEQMLRSIQGRFYRHVRLRCISQEVVDDPRAQECAGTGIHREPKYILPAFFAETVEVSGLLKTTGHIALVGRSPGAFAELIIKKLRKAGVRLKQAFSYSDEAKADADFPLKNGTKIAGFIKAMRTYNWYQQILYATGRTLLIAGVVLALVRVALFTPW